MMKSHFAFYACRCSAPPCIHSYIKALFLEKMSLGMVQSLRHNGSLTGITFGGLAQMGQMRPTFLHVLKCSCVFPSTLQSTIVCKNEALSEGLVHFPEWSPVVSCFFSLFTEEIFHLARSLGDSGKGLKQVYDIKWHFYVTIMQERLWKFTLKPL